ncbi:hypothetical protein BOTBODRAFT_112061 [Botryobasidium botryosum FD-172 SS1]|uniref:Kinesin-like protein n=1 Tax=Botryobasidium botryosum (strain FD-172 SS1) TaxID=930990 RepID=A0A067MED8_BOTB1|nr:hypothetical protein BOTBODRAFT_112061 [Botryobasidium botryosum FD-172 SS1]
MAAERAKVASLETFRENLQTELNSTKTMELETRRNLLAAADENEALKKRHAREIADLEMNLSRKDRECRELRDEIDGLRRDLRAERDTVSALKTTLSTQSTTHLHLNSQMAALQGQRTTLQAQIEEHIGEAAQLRLQLQTERERVGQLEREAMEQETVRRKLHNLVQELKGNIRVFCRVRPPLGKDLPDGLASITFPDKDGREIVLSSTTESATGAVREEVIPFTFDKVFQPHSTQEDVFEEISHLAQSCIDGYNVCIFAYGQTGSGKSFTMEGGSTDATRGMIPRAVHQVFAVAEHLRSKGWEYTMEGQFLEIYNETINDLLGTGDLDKKKHDIKHDKNGRTTVSDVVTIPLESPSQVRALLARAQSHRTVHATLMNERSSRSHSVFTLRISGKNPLTSESCEGSLNLVDLAGSERLNSSGAASDKDRLRETQAINKSLSALGDVIAALGEKAGSAGNNSHVPYRNSKLTYLLQNSLSGNSKTLMVLNLSPLAAHQGESLCSLRFATKVNNTTIGTARKQVQKPS